VRRAAPLGPEAWGFARNAADHLVVGGCDVVELSQQYGTPLHVVDEDALRRAARGFRRSFGAALGEIDVFYSYKTNCIPGVLRILHEEGIGAESISTYETWLALRLGLPGDRILLNGVNKPSEGLALAVAHGLRGIHIDSLEEVPRLAAVLGDAAGPVRVGVRVATGAGWKAQFGVEIESGEALEVYRRLAELPGVVLSGIHVHLGTSVESPAVYQHAAEKMLDLRGEVARTTGSALEYLDLGGGLPVPTVKEFSLRDSLLHKRLGLRATPPDPRRPGWDAFAAVLASALEEGTRRTGLPAPKVYFEPGRALTSQAQVLLLGVGVVKERADGSRIAITDGGRSTNAAPLGNEYHEVLLANRLSASGARPHGVVGGLCTPGDWTFVRKDLPDLAPGDLLAVMDAGAYFTSFSNDFAFPRPAVVIACEGRARIARQRERFEYMVGMDEDLPPLPPALAAPPRGAPAGGTR
jgi:diaminopimelate decarboxylase